MRVINPTTEQPASDYADHTPEQVEQALHHCRRAFHDWRYRSFTDRATLFLRLAELLRTRAPELAQLMAAEMGKPLAAGEAEAQKCALGCEYFAHEAERILHARVVATDAARSYVRHDPLGPILAIMPWNFPLWQFFRFAGGALMAGNTAVLKHAPNVPGCAEAIARLFDDAGFPSGVVVNVRIPNDQAERLIHHDALAAVTLTGSERAGKAVAASAASVLKKTVLELGGSDPFIILPDADLNAVAPKAADARCLNTGQSCIAAKRFIVVGPPSRADDFAQRLADAMARLRIGDPTDRATQLGPMARLDLLENLEDQVRRSISAGARLIKPTDPAAPPPAQRLPRKGFFVTPGVLADVAPGMPAFDDETFGPIAAVITAADIDHALGLANKSRYGLGAGIWTADPQRAEPLAARLDVGNIFINGMVKSDPRLPFGGVKNSGWGRELSSEGLLEFTNGKTVWVA
jgi:succinate-semialdehyde dehydrogenase/glutarate-semialdehyde dehydrogenase